MGGSAGGGGCGEISGTAEHPAELEPNEVTASANALPAGAKGFTASLCPGGDVDVFSVTLAGGESIAVGISDGKGGCPSASLPLVTVLDSMGEMIAADTGFGCLKLEPLTTPVLGSLPSGVYYVQVENAEPGPGSSYVIDLGVRPPSCGDGIVQIAEGEQCDDGAVAGGDGCSAACQLEGDFVSEVEPNDTPAGATSLGGAQGAVGALSPAGDVDVYSFSITTPGSAVSALVSDGLGGCPYGFDSTLTLLDPNGSPLAFANDGGAELCSYLDPLLQPGATALPAGTYTIVVASNDGLGQPWYALSIAVLPPGCGDAVRVPGEQCDDANTASGDGCSSACQSESPWEIEPNDDLGHATPLWPGTALWRGWLSPIGDHDWYTFTVPQGANVTLSTNAAFNAGSCDFDTVIHLVDGQGNELTSNDEAGLNSCSKLSPAANPQVANMAAGTYHVWVQEVSETPQLAEYELRIKIE